MTMTMMMMMEIGTDGGGHGGGGGGGGGTTGVAAVPNGNDNHAGDNGVFVYIVQRRGYAGWQQSQSPPVDYRRLLMTRSEADQVAYGSAHHFAQGGPVRTIQLPDGTFGFVSANHLYWVRKVSATATTNGSSNNNHSNNNKIFGEAHCVLSDGLLGGTCPRRHVLVAERHSIYVGPHSAHAALQYLMSNRSLAERGATIQWVPVGPPPSLAQLAQEWPVVAASVGVDGGGTGMDLSESSTASSRSRSKRTGDDDDNVVWFHRPAPPGPPRAAVENDHHVNRMVMETTRSTKRACWAQRNNNAAEQGMAIELNE
jgi:hypothetical protein